jgi:hypothetical protein
MYNDLVKESYYNGIKQGITTTILGLFMMSKITEEVADQYINSYKNEIGFEDIITIYEENKIKTKEKLNQMGKL